MRSARQPLTLALLATLATLVSCSGDETGSTSGTTVPAPAPSTGSTAPATTAAIPEPLVVVVTNDDGIEADGLTRLVRALEEVPGLEIVVVAPATNQSGTSDTISAGEVEYSEVSTPAGINGYAVQGTPADSVNVALDELGLEPDLVVSGINFGQNASWAIPLSGTVGAARTAARRGIPAIAVSGGTEGTNFDDAARLVVDEIVENLSGYSFGANTERTVVNINVPVCGTGEVRDIVDVPVAYEAVEGVDFFVPIDCTSSAVDPANDALALVTGFASRSIVPADL